MVTLKQIKIGGITVGTPINTTPVAQNKIQVIQSMRFVNTSTTAAVTLNVSVGPSGAERLIAPKNLSLGAGQAYIDETQIVLQYNDQLRAEATGSGGPVDYVISGFEREAS